VQSTALGPQNSFKILNHINSGAWRRPKTKLSSPGSIIWWEREECTREMSKPPEEGKVSKGGNIKSVTTAHLNSTELRVIKSNPNSAISYKRIMLSLRAKNPKITTCSTNKYKFNVIDELR